MFGSNNFVNAAWTVPSLLFCGRYMQGKVGQLKMLKFTTLALTGVLATKLAFSPSGTHSVTANF